MLELVIVFILITVVVFLIGVPLTTYFSWILTLMGVLLALSILFFIISLVFFLFSKKEECRFAGTKSKEDSKIKYAFYELQSDNKLCKNVYPTDSLSEKIFYKKEYLKVNIFRFKEHAVAFDTTAVVTMVLGIILFSLMIVVIIGLLSMLAL